MCGDYGFRSGTGKIYEETDGSIPSNIWQLVRCQAAFGLRRSKACCGFDKLNKRVVVVVVD